MIFTDTITLYHHTDGTWERTIIRGVQWKEKVERVIGSDGVLKLSDYVSITIPFSGERYDIDAKGNLDFIVYGISEEDVSEDNFREVASRGVTVKSVSDNTRRDYLKHWKVVAV